VICRSVERGYARRPSSLLRGSARVWSPSTFDNTHAFAKFPHGCRTFSGCRVSKNEASTRLRHPSTRLCNSLIFHRVIGESHVLAVRRFNDLLVLFHGSIHAGELSRRPLAPDVAIEVALGHGLALLQDGDDPLLDFPLRSHPPRREVPLNARPHPFDDGDRSLEVVDIDLLCPVTDGEHECPLLHHHGVPDLHVVR